VSILQYSNKPTEKSNIEKSIGIFRGKQATYNKIILDALYNNRALSSWEIAGRIASTGRKYSLNAIIFKSLQRLEKKGYVSHAERKWVLRFKGFIANLLIQENPKPLSNIWVEIKNDYVKFLKEHPEAFNRVTIRINNKTVINSAETIDTNLKIPKTFEDWKMLSDYCKGIIQKGIINLDVISEETLLSVLMTEAFHEQLETFLKKGGKPEPLKT